ncbi:cytochrome c oxidase accessory protein CcoG [Pseudorhodoplanes sinuspersici]|uniref:Cytochrome c oxidase accessory protein CcoG n=1 Tax=Pseudorhodoplanes sinuspersici TaxID=1235591 RepID=A0A1W6ZSX8_9HYPH|nr:cytochrome c oxidase accessory protein CcoG [Pseudorhodoplanes sinuspersici]ARQ00529.1 cytochrome c oxidase accessory protein CcoG [Pseudorhodoplanes sinuspersici]RKE67280.1 cytochrome c oxidase accessory protein FixG [Pseudorhodoplanes sinuspersici]
MDADLLERHANPDAASRGASVAPSNIPEDETPLYAARRKIYPQSVKGTFRRIKWAVLLVTLAIYYFLPFIRWNRGPNAPDQAVLIDFSGRRFYFFFIEIWPQEVYFFTGLLIIAAMTLFLMNAVAGRVWCGYLCPQTVWTDLFLAIERLVEGDRRAQMAADAGPWTAQRVLRKGLKHLLWLMVAWWTGGAWVLYFADAPTLVKDLATGHAPFLAYAWIGILTATTYALAGHMREQVCTYMCPWPRIQAALTDEYALNVTYRYDRGEPRSSVKKSEQLRLAGLPAGDCVDCRQCVNVCPTGIDIRNGAQLECIQCGLCIDACDSVMDKIGRPPRLIGYDSDVNLKRRIAGEPPVQKIIRTRTVMYALIIAAVGGIMLYALLTRHAFDVSVIHDRNPVFVRLADGAIRNGYTMRILNKQLETRRFALTVDGVPGNVVEIVGLPLGAARIVEVGPDQSREFRVLVNSYEYAPAASSPIVFHLTDVESGTWAQARDHFRAPERPK